MTRHGLDAPVVVLVGAALAVACADGPTAPQTPTPHDALDVDAAVNGGPHRTGDDALSIEDMLSDPLFQAAVEGITEAILSDPLLDAVSALEAGQVGRASPLLSKASAIADALLDDPSVDFDSLILWSVLERFFEEAELL